MPPIVSHPIPARVAYGRMNAELVDFVQLTDSNGEYQNTGFSRARRRSLAARFTQYAGQAIDFSGGAGWAAENDQYSFGSGDTGFATSGAPSALNAVMNPSLATRTATYPMRYCYWGSAGYTSATPLNIFQNYDSTHACNIAGEALEFHLSYGTFDSGSGKFRPSVQKPGGSPIAQVAEISTNTGAIGVAWSVLSFSYSGQSALRFHPVTPNGGVLVNPVCIFFHRLVRPGVTAGFGSGMYVAQGGDGLRQFARVLGVADGADGPDSLGAMSNAQLDHGMDALTRGQGADFGLHNMVLVVRSSFNDANPTNTRLSVGSAPADSNTPEGYYDNLGALYDRWKARWEATGRDPARLSMEIAPGHPTDPDNAEYIALVAAAKDFAADNSNCWVLDQRAIVTGAEMTARSHYGFGGEHMNHVPNSVPGDGVSNAYDYYDKLMIDGLFKEIRSASSAGGARRLFLLGGSN